MGFLADEKSPEVIANLIDRLISDRQEMTKMASYNHFFAKKHFMASVVAKRINDIYLSENYRESLKKIKQKQ